MASFRALGEKCILDPTAGSIECSEPFASIEAIEVRCSAYLGDYDFLLPLPYRSWYYFCCVPPSVMVVEARLAHEIGARQVVPLDLIAQMDSVESTAAIEPDLGELLFLLSSSPCPCFCCPAPDSLISIRFVGES